MKSAQTICAVQQNWFVFLHTHTHALINIFLITNKFTSRRRFAYVSRSLFHRAVGTIVNAAAGHRKEIKCSTDWWQLLHASIKTRLIFIVGQASKVTRRKWSTTHTKWNIYVFPSWVKHIHMYCTFASACAAVCVCVQCTYLPYITHTLRFVVCACFCLLSLCFVFNPFQKKMLRFDFIFLSFCFNIFAAYFAAHFEASGTFSPAALYTHTCIIYNTYILYTYI